MIVSFLFFLPSFFGIASIHGITQQGVQRGNILGLPSPTHCKLLLLSFFLSFFLPQRKEAREKKKIRRNLPAD